MQEVKKLGNIYGFNGGNYAGNVYDQNGLAPNFLGMEGGNRQPMIVAMRGRNPDNPSDRTAGIKLEQRLEPQQEGICNTLTSVNKDNLVIERCKYIGNINPSGRGMGEEVTDTNGISRTLTVGKSEPNKILIKQATKTGYIECDVGGVADLSYPESKTRRGRVQNGGQVSPALTVSGVDGIRKVESPYRIRKLTPLECWRLMGFTDEDFHKAEAVNSNTQLYKQAGNSIVVDVLVGIFKQIIEAMEVEEMKKIEEVKTVKFETDKMIDLAKLQEEEPELFEELAADYPCEDATYIFKVQKIV